MARLDGKIALITAAGQGIGRATALRFANEGAIVWATDINGHALDALRSENPAIQTRILDVLDSKAVETTAEETGTIDVFIQLRGLCASAIDIRMLGERVELLLGFQCHFDVSHLPSLSARNARQWKRKHHQYVVDRLKFEGSTQPFRLRSNEGRRDRAYQKQLLPISSRKASVAMPCVPEQSRLLLSATESRPWEMQRKYAQTSWPASRWEAL
jgi:NAD(P)-dependent dehydrogenase (short-subunit alcohol dehydrogenase family)